MIGDHLQQYTYEYLIGLALSFVPDDRDKRQGSVIYDALAPFCQLLAAGALQLRNFYTQTYATTATGEDLENRVAEQGLSRYAATYAVKKLTLADKDGNPMVVPLGTRFSTISDTNPINYKVTSQYMENDVAVIGTYEATCEEAGIIGNEYFGNVINITFIQGIASAYLSSTLVPARDEETDDKLRERYFEALNQKSFGGNIADYKTRVGSMPGVGDLQIYPTWNGGGTVKLSIVDPTYSPCAREFLESLQQTIDPENANGVKGTGLGIAPIGHQVTVVTPEEVDISVSASIDLQAQYTIGQVETAVTTALSNHIQSLRETWADANEMNEYTCNIFIARITGILITIPGIANVHDVKINGAPADIFLTENGTIQQLPKLGEVILNV